MQQWAVLHWNRRLECLNRISQKALERSLECFFHAQIFAENAGQPEKLDCVIRPVGMTDFNSFGAEYRGATFVGVERQSLHQVKGGSLAQFIVVATISTGYYLPQMQGFIGFAVKKQNSGEERNDNESFKA